MLKDIKSPINFYVYRLNNLASQSLLSSEALFLNVLLIKPPDPPHFLLALFSEQSQPSYSTFQSFPYSHQIYVNQVLTVALNWKLQSFLFTSSLCAVQFKNCRWSQEGGCFLTSLPFHSLVEVPGMGTFPQPPSWCLHLWYFLPFKI